VIVEHLLRVARVGSVWILYVLIALSVLSIAAMIERWRYFRALRDPRGDLRRKVATALRAGDLAAAEQLLAASPAAEARIVREALAWRAGGAEAVADAIDSELDSTRQELERGSNFLGTLGNNAPFVGLLGTVLGVIEAFEQLGDGDKAAMGNVMSGIAEALIATGVGLFVALPAVVAYNLAQKRIAAIEGATSALGKLVTAYLKAEAHGATGTGARPAVAAAAPADERVASTVAEREVAAVGSQVAFAGGE